MKRYPFLLVVATVVATLTAVHTMGCGATRSARSLAAEQVYVAPEELDKYYAFLSGGQSGSVFVVGIPSGRLIREIPVFEPRGTTYAVCMAELHRFERDLHRHVHLENNVLFPAAVEIEQRMCGATKD